MKHSWFTSILPISAIFAFRMLGLFMLIPVFTLYAPLLQGATPLLIGLALGGYGLSQGLLQLPFGMFSDHFGRKKILTLGLILFIAGSLLGAISHSIYTMILARLLQGAGAIGSVLIALLADLTPDSMRTKAMAVVGMSIGLSFSLSMVLSPALAQHYGLAGIFYLTALLGLLALLLLHTVIPNPVSSPFHTDKLSHVTRLRLTLQDKNLLRLNVSIFCQHFVLTSTFFVLPLLLQHQIQIGALFKLWHFYLPLILCAFLGMLPFVFLAEKKQQMKKVLFCAVLATALSQLFLAFNLLNHWALFCTAITIYFIAFNILEASLPALVSKQAGSTNKGTAMGVYSSSQFLGIFVGGMGAGYLYTHFGYQGIFYFNALFTFFWLLNSLFIQPKAYITALELSCSLKTQEAPQMIAQLKKIMGVTEAVFVAETGRIHLLVNKASYQEGSAEKMICFLR